MPGATIVDFILRLWHDSPSNAKGKAPFTVQKFLIAIGYKEAEAWPTEINWEFDFWELPDPPIDFCQNEGENVDAWKKLKAFAAALSKSSTSTSKKRRGGKGADEPQTLSALKSFVKSQNDGYSQGRDIFLEVIKRKWYKANKVMDQLVEETSLAQCYPVTVLLEDHDILGSPDSLSLAPSLELELHQVVAEVVLGKGAFRKGERLDICTEFRSGISLLASNFFWFNHCRKRVKKKVALFNKAKEEMDALLKVPDNQGHALSEDHMDPLRKGYKKYRSISEQFKNDATALEHRSQVTMQLDCLKIALEQQSAPGESGEIGAYRSSKLIQSNIKSLNTPEAIDSMKHEIQEWLEQLDRMYEQTEMFEIPDIQEDIGDEDPLGTDDLGVETWKNKTKDWLRQCLGWGDSDGPYIQPFGSTVEPVGEGRNLWDQAYASLKQNKRLPENFYPHEAMWHQLVAVVAIIHNVFKSESSKEPPSPEGMAVFDEVGLGKTLEVILVISFLNGLIDSRRGKKADPPLLNGRPYLSGHDEVPNRPHLIVVPNTLIPQWKQSLSTWLKPGAADILVYAEGKQAREGFWTTHGPYETSSFKKSGELHRIVILASKEAVNKDHRIYTGQDKGLRAKSCLNTPWIPMSPAARPTGRMILQSQSFLSMWVDEAHIYRNNISSLLPVARSCAMLVALTATPLFTGHKDLLSIGHLLKLEGLCSQAAMERHKGFTNAIEKARVAQRVAMNEGSDDKASEGSISSELKNLISAQLNPISWLKDSFKGHIIRRTGESRDFEGQPLVGLCPHKPLVYTVSLSKEEMGLIQAAYHDSGEEGRREGTVFDPWAFYSGPRQENLSPGLDKSFRNFASQYDFKEKGGTKLKALVSLISFFVQYGNGVDPVLDSNGELSNDPSSLDATSNGSSVLVYCNWLRQVELIQSALKVNNINSEYATSCDTVHIRNKTLMAFSSKRDRQGSPCKVLIISGVGTTGLNISAANVVIFADQLWSSQEERQVIGRVQRKGQTRAVTIVWLLAADTTDILLYRFAQGKAKQTLFGSEHDSDDGSDGSPGDDEIAQHQQHKRKPSKDIAEKGKKQKIAVCLKKSVVDAPSHSSSIGTIAAPSSSSTSALTLDPPNMHSSCGPVGTSNVPPTASTSANAPMNTAAHSASSTFLDDSGDMFNSMVQGASLSSPMKDTEPSSNTEVPDYPDGAMNTTAGQSPSSSFTNSPILTISDPLIPESAIDLGSATPSVTPGHHSRELAKPSKDSSQLAGRSGSAGTSFSGRHVLSRLEALSSDSDDGMEMIIKPYTPLTKKKGPRGH